MSSPPQLTLPSLLMLLALAAVWGGSFFFAEIALTELSPMTVTLHRVLWALPMLFVVVKFAGVPIPTDPKVWGAYLVMGALNNAIPFTLIFWGQTQIDSGLASILNGMTAISGAVIAGLLLKDEPLTAPKIFGALFGVAGVAVIVGPDALQSLSLANIGQFAILLAGVSYSLASVWGRTKLGRQPPLVNALGMIAGSTVLMVPLVFLVDGVPKFEMSATVFAAMLGLVMLSTVLAYLLYFAVLVRAGAANLMLVTLLIPPFAIALGVLFLGEVMTLTAWIGFALIAVGLLVTDGRIFRGSL
ncbi:Uncharacterized membrane protein [Cognatiyoonia sediminum]|uniref:Uncharacterized membrane protein n=1 Tax=Cognatiyoonia sediminum TaxID=1508389 RepID=A0A1M5LPL9_9RHOB|nr:DMT family transporter [Cognatiyoonia sediminum]SHG66303.1 Uncharacterized membrane protein [Cognatiyoonia sediminum]